MIVQPLARRFDPDVERALVARLETCRDLAFAYLVEVRVPEHSSGSDPTLLAWLVRESLGSLKSSLDLLAGAVAATIPEDSYVDVVILNSAPELLGALEATGDPLLVRDREELEEAFAAYRAGPSQALEPAPRKPWFWPF